MAASIRLSHMLATLADVLGVTNNFCKSLRLRMSVVRCSEMASAGVMEGSSGAAACRESTAGVSACMGCWADA